LKIDVFLGPSLLALFLFLPIDIIPGMANIKITYRFLFTNDRRLEHEVLLDADTARVISVSPRSRQSWTDLENKKCRHCPLKKEEHPECPVAKNLALVADAFKREKSIEQVLVEVETVERMYRKNLRLQEGLFGLFGLIMATSDCPYMEFLRPMARFHLPFSTLRETTVRAVSFYLLRQYFVAKKGGKPDYDLAELRKHYEHLEGVNLGMAERIRSVTEADAEANSIVILHTFAQLLSDQLTNQLPDLEKMFKS
jgi:hypothetical protein